MFKITFEDLAFTEVFYWTKRPSITLGRKHIQCQFVAWGQSFFKTDKPCFWYSALLIQKSSRSFMTSANTAPLIKTMILYPDLELWLPFRVSVKNSFQI